MLLDSKALTKIQSIILIVIVAVAVVGGAVYVLVSGDGQTSETIKIGVIGDLNAFVGKGILQGATLAVEQINAEGGVLGMKVEIVKEDDDCESGNPDPSFASNSFARLVTVDAADFIVAQGYSGIYQEIASEHKKILFNIFDTADGLTQRVIDNYDRYKYYFRTGYCNQTAAIEGITETVIVCRNQTGFNKIAFLYHDGLEFYISPIIDNLKDAGFDVVFSAPVNWQAMDFSSYFARAEASGAEILYPLVVGEAGIPFVKEYYDRQSPMIMWGHIDVGGSYNFWEATEGKCEYIATGANPVVAGFPLTSWTVSTRDAYVERWDEDIISQAAGAYDTVRFILADALERAGSIETEAVIDALEETDIETSLCRRFVFTPSHDIMIGKEGLNKLSEDYYFVAEFQWQDGELVPVYPTELMEEAGATYKFPPWSGPWDNIS